MNFEGMNYKAYYYDTNWSNNPPKHIESIRVYGEITVQLCTSGYGTCTSYVPVRQRELSDLYGLGPYGEDYLDPGEEVTGIRVYSAGSGSVFGISSVDVSQGTRDFCKWMADTTGEVGSESKKSSWVRWDEYGANRLGLCYDYCSNNWGQCPEHWCRDLCSDVLWDYIGMTTQADREYAADASLTIINGHAGFSIDDPYNRTYIDIVKQSTSHCAWNGHAVREASVWHSRDCVDDPDGCLDDNGNSVQDHDHEYGHWNTDWLIALGCDTFGDDATSWTDVCEAYNLLLKSGVHGIGGFRGSELIGQIRTRKESAILFWDELGTYPVGTAWLNTMHGGINHPGYISAESCDPCRITNPDCKIRRYSDYYIGQQTGPLADIQDGDVNCYHHSEW